MKTRQEIFDLAYKGIASQGWKASEGDVDGKRKCFYRKEVDGQMFKCAIGWNLPDDKYVPDMDDFDGCMTLAAIMDHCDIDRDNLDFCRRLQDTHDAAKGQMKFGLEHFARMERLVIPAL